MRRALIVWTGDSLHENPFIGHSLSLCFCLTVVVALSQDAPNQPPRKTQAAAGDRLTTIMGTVQEGGDKLRFVTDQRVWNVDNPEILEGHEGHYVHAKAYIYPDQNS